MDLLHVLYDLFVAALKRRNAPRSPFMLAARGGGGAKPAPELRVSRPAKPAPVTAAAPPDAVAPPPRLAPADGPASAEGGLVVSLFANPRTLAAAFIVAEVLAKPVALRDRV